MIHRITSSTLVKIARARLLAFLHLDWVEVQINVQIEVRFEARLSVGLEEIAFTAARIGGEALKSLVNKGAL